MSPLVLLGISIVIPGITGSSLALPRFPRPTVELACSLVMIILFPTKKQLPIIIVTFFLSYRACDFKVKQRVPTVPLKCINLSAFSLVSPQSIHGPLRNAPFDHLENFTYVFVVRKSYGKEPDTVQFE